MGTAKTDPDLTVETSGMVGLINGQDLSAFLVGQSEKPLDMVELVHVFPLVKKNLAVTVVDDSFLHDRGTDDVIHFLGDHHSLPEIFSNRLEKIAYVLTHIGGHQGFPAFLNEYHFADAFQTAHLGDEGFHDYQRDHGQKHLVSADIVQFKYDKAFVGKIQFLVRIKQEIIITATVERFQHVQETVDVKILLTDFLLLNHPAVVITHKLIESVEIGSDIPVFRYPADVCVHRSRKGHFFRTPWGFILTFPECEYQCLDAFTLFHVKFPGIRIERIEGDGIVLLIGDIDTILAMCPVMNQAAKSLIAVSGIHQQDMGTLFIILADKVVRKEGFTAAGGTEYELVAVGDDSLAHGQVTDVQMKRYTALPVRHTDTKRAGRTAIIRFRSKQADSLFQKGIETFLSRKIARIARDTRPVQHRSIYRVVMRYASHQGKLAAGIVLDTP